MNGTHQLDRRQFIGTGARLGAGLLAAGGLAACDDDDDDQGTSANSSGTTGATTAPSTVPPTTIPSLSGRRLVVVQMNGGNDALNTLPPTAGKYRDLRPTLAVPEAEVLALGGVDDAGLHPALSALTPFWDGGRMAVLRGIGFADPNRSHFVSMDRWWRADDMSAPGWLGRVLDQLPEQAPLYATALGAGAPVLNGASRPATVVTGASTFRWVGIQPQSIVALAAAGDEGDDGALAAQMRGAFGRTAQAVAEFAEVTGTSPDGDELPAREGAASLADGLAVAAQLLASDVGTELVVVSASGFDTHSGQAGVHRTLLADFADGVAAFFAALDEAGLTDEVLLVSTSEFGRRVEENASGGCDHGAGGLSFVFGNSVQGGMHGDWSLADLLDGDLRPQIDPFVLFTACLDWIGADAEQVLGRRDDSLQLLR